MTRNLFQKVDLVEVVAKKAVHVSPLGSAFVKSEVRRGLLPILLEEILATRLLVKASLRLHKDSRVCDRTSLVLETSATT